MLLRAASGRRLLLGYGMNVHAGGDVATWERALAETVAPLRRRLGARGPFGLAVRLDAAGAHELVEDAPRRAALVARHQAEGLLPFTGNAFVAGRFHGGRVKDAVYAPTWGTPERTAYTLEFARALAAFHGPGAQLSLSTAPGPWKGWRDDVPPPAARAAALAETAEGLRRLEEETGVRVRLGLEPEPGCDPETTDETLAWFRGPLDAAWARAPEARPYVGVCYDVCHQAVLHEDVAAGLEALLDEGIPVVKVQLSVAVELRDPADEAAREALAGFDEGTWLHQVAAPTADGVHFAPDLDVALADPQLAREQPWRVHFHVPVDRQRLAGGLATTAPALEAALDVVARREEIEHLEIETYSFGALPPADRPDGPDGPLVEGLLGEFRHVLDGLARRGIHVEEVA
ncbi:MAG: metabolite traffic protein EboE [Planctomycetota bacterium]